MFCHYGRNSGVVFVDDDDDDDVFFFVHVVDPSILRPTRID
jgi:hypothetical protein